MERYNETETDRILREDTLLKPHPQNFYGRGNSLQTTDRL